MRYVILLISVFLGYMFKGQVENRVFPPSPNSAQFGKYIDTPVALNTGIPRISIPIAKISEKGIDIPISIDYHSGGIKVEEIASDVGLGWSLNAGGRIYRVVKDKPDDYSNKGFLFNQQSNLNTIFDDIAVKGNDVETDVYMFSFLNYSGKFIFDKSTNQFIQQPLSDLKIMPIVEGTILKGFVVKDDKGNKYYFGYNLDRTRLAVDRYERTDAYSNDSKSGIVIGEELVNIPYINTWHLTEIKTPSNNSIKFLYNEATPSEQVIRNNEYITYGSFPNTNLFPTTQYLVINGTQQSLDKIIGNNVEIKINYSTKEREDLKNAKNISQIEIVGKNSYKTLDFVHSYFSSNSHDDPFINAFGDHYTKRLKLDAAIFTHKKESQKDIVEKYSFFYNGIELPNRFSYSQDYWGFFNNEPNRSLVPEYYIGTHKITPIVKAVRSVNPIYSKAGLLSKIVFPTGGYHEFTYESNTASLGGIIFKDGNKLLNLKEAGERNVFDFTKSVSTKVDEGNYMAYFDIGDVIGEVSVDVQLPSNCGENASLECGILIELKDENNRGIYYALTSSKKYLLSLPKGRYKISATDFDPYKNNDFYVRISWEKKTSGNSISVGGVRIKNITINDGSGHEIIKEYDYNIDTLSSGNVTFAPVLRSDFRRRGLGGAFIIDKINGNSNYPTINVGKSETYYTKVSETINRDIKTEYYYDGMGELSLPITLFGLSTCGIISNDIRDITDLFKNRAETTFTLRRGNLINKSEYKLNQERKFNLIKREFFKYKEDNIYVLENQSAKYDLEIYNGNNGACKTNSRYFFYSQRTSNLNLYEKTTELFDNGKVMKTITEHFYDNPSHYQPTSQTTTFPDGTTQTTEYDYAHEKGNQYLIDKNMVGIPLETRVSKNGKLISKVETVYPLSQADANTYTEGLPLPKETRTLDLGISSKNHQNITYTKYDNKGNLLEYKINGITPVAVVWGYNQTQPIAKIEGVGYDYIKDWILDIVQKSNQDKDTATEKTLLQALNAFRNRDELKNFQVTTYTYDPLVGVTSITPPSGITEYYKYDAANRLEKVVDADNKVLKEYKYNYKQ
ncbi:hypothetical protein JSO59_002530 [Riemerella anatipestifer]|uniref:hypothetical protein n=1 Tax=Riemerella anatipestifer TaxID=34085 RepID=UPI0030C2EE82